MKFKKVGTLVLSSLLVVTTVSPVVSHANTKSFSQETINEDLISKASPYVYLDPTSEKFKIKMGKENYLTHEELKEVQDILAKTNEDVKLYRSDLVISGDKFVPKKDLSQDSGIQYQIIDKSKNFDYEFT
ncbi:hypothetical protein V7146_13450 [Gottfriedia acidiceleris]|uniref:hypothetical protein n=1 Tax=Gottfriedia acidiceleris TaxID=371036 RepID=UPI003000B41A